MTIIRHCKPRFLLSLLIAACIAAWASPCHAANDNDDAPNFTLVIDPGHGGKDVGCQGKKGREKDITLAVSKLFGEKVAHRYGEQVEVVFTRDDDRYLTLQQRADKANDAMGDLFVSIHVNSVDRKNRNRASIQGTSVYTCGLHKSNNNLAVAMRENSVMELEEDYSATYQGFDPNSTESYIIFELSRNKHLQQSIDFASMAQNRLVKTAGRADKDVRQAGFWVLWATSMPSVLVELDFICNPTQEAFLTSAKGQEKCAQALFEAFEDYYGTIR